MAVNRNRGRTAVSYTHLVVSDDAVQKKHNFHYNLWEMEKGGAKTRYQWNIDAIRTLKDVYKRQHLWRNGMVEARSGIMNEG